MVKVKPLEDKDFEARGKYFELGVHEVYITSFERGTTPNTGSEFIEFGIVGENNEEDSVRLYLTEKAAEMTLKILGGIAVHNQDTEEKKQKVRQAFKDIDDTDKLTDKMLERFKDMQAWILTEEDMSSQKPNGGFYRRNRLFSYEPNPPKAQTTTVEDLMGGGTKTDDGTEIPF